MYLWRVAKLAQDFRENRVSERDQVPYVITFLLGTIILSNPYLLQILGELEPNHLDALAYSIQVLGLVVGTLVCYRTFYEKPGRSGFLPRYLCLGVTTGIRLGTLMVLAFGLLYLVEEILVPVVWINDYLNTDETTIIDLLMMIAWEFLFYFYLSRAIRWSYA